MAKSSHDVQRNVTMLKKAMGMRGDLKPGDLTLKAQAIMASPQRAAKVAKKLPPLNTQKGVGVRGII